MAEWRVVKKDGAFLARRDKATFELQQALVRALRQTYIPVESSYQYVVVTLTPYEAKKLIRFLESKEA